MRISSSIKRVKRYVHRLKNEDITLYSQNKSLTLIAVKSHHLKMAEEIAKEICLRPRRRLSFPNMQHFNRRSEPFVSTFTNNNRINDKQAGSKRQGIDSVRRLTVSMFSLRG